jgi:CCR4-NOT transcription complex subunit 10
MAVQSRNTSDQAQQQQTIESLNASDPYVMSLYHNNLGCIHMATGKPNAARYTFNDAINLHNAAIRDDSAGLLAARKDYMLRLKNCELVYNLGVNLLHIGQHRESFDTLMRTSSLLAKSSHLWLHLAECCIAHNSEKRDGFKELVAVPPAAVSKKQRGQQQYQQVRTLYLYLYNIIYLLDLIFQDTDAANVTFMLEGASAHQKIILVRQQTGGQQQQRQKKQQEEEEDNKNKNSIRKKRVPSHHPDLTMEFAHHCLENAAYNLDAWSGNRPNPLPITSRPIVLRAAILLKQSYVALCLDNPTVAYRHSKRLLDLANNSNGSSVPAGHKVLGRLYCGEALVLLDRISEAADYLDPLTVQDVSFEDARNADDPGPTGSNVGVSGGSASGGNSNRHAATTASEMIAARALFSYNLAVAFLIRGEIERAGEMLEALAGQANQHKVRKSDFTALLVRFNDI